MQKGISLRKSIRTLAISSLLAVSLQGCFGTSVAIPEVSASLVVEKIRSDLGLVAGALQVENEGRRQLVSATGELLPLNICLSEIKFELIGVTKSAAGSTLGFALVNVPLEGTFGRALTRSQTQTVEFKLNPVPNDRFPTMYQDFFEGSFGSSGILSEENEITDPAVLDQFMKDASAEYPFASAIWTARRQIQIGISSPIETEYSMNGQELSIQKIGFAANEFKLIVEFQVEESEKSGLDFEFLIFKAGSNLTASTTQTQKITITFSGRPNTEGICVAQVDGQRSQDDGGNMIMFPMLEEPLE